MSRYGPLADLVALLDETGTAYMLVGSLASTYHGPPRSTRDIDVVVELTEAALVRLLDRVDRERFYVADVAAHAAGETEGQFNLVDLVTGWKIDLIIRKDRPFSREEFARRWTAIVDDVELSIASPEEHRAVEAAVGETR